MEKCVKQKCPQDQHKDQNQERTYKAETQHQQIKIIITNKTQAESEILKQQQRTMHHKQGETSRKKMNL